MCLYVAQHTEFTHEGTAATSAAATSAAATSAATAAAVYVYTAAEEIVRNVNCLTSRNRPLYHPHVCVSPSSSINQMYTNPLQQQQQQQSHIHPWTLISSVLYRSHHCSQSSVSSYARSFDALFFIIYFAVFVTSDEIDWFLKPSFIRSFQFFLWSIDLCAALYYTRVHDRVRSQTCSSFGLLRLCRNGIYH